MVGTKPTRRPSRLHASRSARTSATSRTTFTRLCMSVVFVFLYFYLLLLFEVAFAT
jgi:hypothetical protein